MTDIAVLQRVGLAVAIGLLIGIERGWQEREAQAGARVAGIRTFTLISLLGAICAQIAGTNRPLIMGLAFVGFAFPFGLFEYRRAREARSFSVTGFVAGLLVFALGAYAVLGSMTVAAACGVVTTAILAARRVLHAFLQRLKWKELRAAIVLLVMTAVLLPLLPDRAVDPWGALNPHTIWLMTVLIGFVSYAGYIAIRLAGERRGLIYAGLMGGLVTSTTVTWTFARLAARERSAGPAFLTAILGAWIVSLLRMAAIALSIAPELTPFLLPPIVAAAAVLLLPAIAGYLRPTGRTQSPELLLRDPFELSLMAKFLVLLSAIMLLSKLAMNFVGPAGLIPLGGLSGLLDVDPITLSMAGMVPASLSAAVAAETILVAAFTNCIAKAVLGAIFGGVRMGSALAAALLLSATCGAFVYLQTI
jgi:uncharacterized membrane protein (DUF4010 family)